MKFVMISRRTGGDTQVDLNFNLNTGEITELLQKLPSKIKEKVTRNAVAAGARIIREEAKVLVPYDTGRLRDSIYNKRVKGTNDIQKIGVLSGRKGAPHGHLVEFGTVNQPAQPFLRPAYLSQKGAVQRKMIMILGNGILRESRKLATIGRSKK